MKETDLLPDGGSDDLRQKVRAISNTETFAKLDSRNQRLLAFVAQWYTAKPGQKIFSKDDRPDAAYICVQGKACLTFLEENGNQREISEVEPGRMIGDLAVIMNEPRQVNLIAKTEVTFLRIGAEEFRAVIENDNTVLLSLLHTVAGHLNSVAGLMSRIDPQHIPDQDNDQETEGA